MIDHISLRVSNVEKSKNFYKAVLETVGYILDAEYPDACGFHSVVEDKTDSFWILKEELCNHRCAYCFSCEK